MHQQNWRYTDVLLYRTVSGPYARKLQQLRVSDAFANAAYTSTAYDVRHALNFGDCALLLIISPRQGMPYVYVDGFMETYCKGNPQESWLFQSEVLLQKNTTFVVTKKYEKPMDYVLSRLSGPFRFPAQGMSPSHILVMEVAVI